MKPMAANPITMTYPLAPNKPPLCIALPVAEGRLHGHFGGCREFAFIEADPETRTVRAKRTVPAPPHQPGLFPLWLREQGVRAESFCVSTPLTWISATELGSWRLEP